MPVSYSKAPIVEASIDFRVVAPEGITLEDLSAIKEALHVDFPEQHDILEGELKLDAIPQSTIKHIGFKLEDDTKRKVLQITLEGFTFSRLSPYSSWEALRDETQKLWETYKTVCRVSTISRVGVRYINRLNVPVTHKINAYLLLTPSIPQYRNRELGGLFMQLQMPQPDIESMLVINQALVEPPDPDTMSMILDLDLFRQSTWNVQDEPRLWTFLETLRDRKNEVFEASITQKTREMIG